MRPLLWRTVPLTDPGIPSFSGPEMSKLKWVSRNEYQKRQLFVPGPPKFTKSVSFPSAFRATGFLAHPFRGHRLFPDLRVVGDADVLDPRGGQHVAQPRAVEYTRSPSQDFRLFGPRPWKILTTAYEQMGS